MVQEYTLAGGEPPNPGDSPWRQSANSWIVELSIDRECLHRSILVSAETWEIIVEDRIPFASGSNRSNSIG